jgi:hypothetical protein
MTKRPPPRHVVVDGEDGVALTAEEYENLIALRRQVGAGDARQRRLASQVRDLTALVAEIRALTDGHPPCDRPQDDQRQDCLRCQINELIAQRPRHRSH